MSDGPLFSRSGRTNAGGKLTQRLDIPVTEELEHAVIALAAVAGVSKAEWVRAALERQVFGDLIVLRRMSHGTGHRQDEESGSFVG